jgi:hypothetical protein
VVDVRRTDGDTSTFTANQITNGEILDWVNSNWSDDASLDRTSDWSTIDSSIAFDTDKYVLTYIANTQWAILDVSPDLMSNNPITVSVDVKNGTSGNVAVYIGASIIGIGNQTLGQIGTTSDEWQTMTLTVNAEPISFENPSLRFDMTSGTVEFKNFSVIQKNDGYVSRLYDQSGSGNDATQPVTTSQPKIVDAGALVAGGMLFDGVDDTLDITTVAESQPITTFTKYKATASNSFPFGTDATSTISAGRRFNDEYALFAGTVISSGVHPSTDVLSSALFSGASSEAWWNGVSILSGDTGANGGIDSIGASGASRMTGTIAEIIIYDSDQSDNRTAIEANIGETYGITGIPAYDNTVDGFVETWYDQSGNGNDATQSVAGNQPKIVDAGALVSGGIDFDGVDDHFDFTGGKPITSIDAASAFFVGSSDSSSNQCGLNISSSTSSRRFYLPILHSGSFRFGYADSIISVTLASSNTSEHLFTGIAGTSTASGYYDGELKGTVSSETGVSGDEEIGSIGSAYRWNGRMREIIIYPSDQSANRLAIEANINDQYDIY